MTAQNNQVTESDPLYFHVYRELAQEAIFIDDQDFQVFINFLKDYFSDTTDPESVKKTFTIRGRTFQGIPHQPQNFFNQIELLAYKLESNRFDLLIKQIVPGTLEKLIRALSTRYAIYFNKKHHRTGTLFKDSYKSHQIKDLSSLLHLTRDFHGNFSNEDGVPHYSSYPEYLGQRETMWIKSQVVLSIEGVSDYKSFVEGGKSEKSTKEHTSLPKPKPRIPEIILATLILILFSSYGVKKIQTSTSPTTPIQTLTTPSNNRVLGDEEKATENENPKPKQVEEEKVIVVIKINDNSENVNIRQSPSISSPIIGKAKKDDGFEFVSVNSGWYQIKLIDGSTGYISARYAETVKEDNNQ